MLSQLLIKQLSGLAKYFEWFRSFKTTSGVLLQVHCRTPPVMSIYRKLIAWNNLFYCSAIVSIWGGIKLPRLAMICTESICILTGRPVAEVKAGPLKIISHVSKVWWSKHWICCLTLVVPWFTSTLRFGVLSVVLHRILQLLAYAYVSNRAVTPVMWSPRVMKHRVMTVIPN